MGLGGGGGGGAGEGFNPGTRGPILSRSGLDL